MAAKSKGKIATAKDNSELKKLEDIKEDISKCIEKQVEICSDLKSIKSGQKRIEIQYEVIKTKLTSILSYMEPSKTAEKSGSYAKEEQHRQARRAPLSVPLGASNTNKCKEINTFCTEYDQQEFDYPSAHGQKAIPFPFSDHANCYSVGFSCDNSNPIRRVSSKITTGHLQNVVGPSWSNLPGSRKVGLCYLCGGLEINGISVTRQEQQ